MEEWGKITFYGGKIKSVTVSLNNHNIFFHSIRGQRRHDLKVRRNFNIIFSFPLKWIPKPVPVKKKKKKVKYNQSLLSGFGSASLIAESIPSPVS